MSATIDYSSAANPTPVAEGNRIAGERAASARISEVVDPATGRVLATVPLSSAADVEEAVAAASAAGEGWARTPPQERARILGGWAEALLANRTRLAATATAEMGKPLAESLGEVDRAAAEIAFMAGEAQRLTGESIPSSVPGTLVVTMRVPVGLVLAITPWNFPIVSPVRKIAPALAAGNAVVCKPSMEAPLTALALADLAAEAGLPAGVLNVICGDRDGAGAALVASPLVKAISFTGSTTAGRAIAEIAARNLVPVQLELGGKNAVYVDASADLDRAVPEIVSAAIQCSGQRCTAISRVLADEPIADELTERLAADFDRLTVGPGTDPSVKVGPLVSAAHRRRVAGYIAVGIGEGAVVATGRTDAPEGNYVAPAILAGVLPTMRIAREEVFGPVLSVGQVRGVAEAIAVTNDCDYGLASAVFARDIGVALEFVRGAETGMVHVNHGNASQPHVPFGGVKDSGLGAYSIGHSAQEFFTRLKVAYVRG
ncbi:MAG: alpha-ketoglutaric semialdehyde dehydrogenase [Chloroflexota bacterium]|jgi:aldehyde dehydrogenase (NAD+)|nr:alpha-ketoglutaric semialdehyde dehydrogenase [Chloroflexota bacterium]